MNPSLFFFGGKELLIRAKDRTAVMELCLQNGFSYTRFRWEENGDVRFVCTYHAASCLLRLCRRHSLDVSVCATYGIPSVFLRLCRSPGLLIGGAFGIALILLSTNFVWHVDVTGNSTLSDGEVRAVLRECGFGVGSFLPRVKTSEVETRVLIVSDDISWITINREGTVARVQVIERAKEDDAESATPANLVAACDGQIEYFQLYRGNCVVAVGQAVKKGELLVSGIYDSQTVGYRYTRASGRVMARTQRSFCIEIPYSYEEKVYENAKICGITLAFFDFPLKIFKSTGNMRDNCDIIEKETVLDQFGSYPLPLSLTVTYANPYAVQTKTRDEESAAALAYEELERQLSALSGDVQLLEKRIVCLPGETGVRLECTLSCIEDIAVQKEFEIEESAEG